MFNLRNAINEVCDIMRFQLTQKGLDLKIHINQNVPEKIFTDQKRFRQVLYNLLGNAAKFTFTGFLSVAVKFSDGQLTTDVEDSGIGISSEDLEKLFKFFGALTKTRDINRGGMGLGLTISKMILHQLKGNISVKSEP